MKTLKILASAFLTVIVIPTLMLFIIYLSASTILSKKNIESVIKDVNVSNFLIDDNGEYNELGKEIKDDLVKNGLPEAVVDEFLESEEITEFFAKYAGELIDYLINDGELSELDADTISNLINDNIDSIVQELRDKKVEGYEQLTDERIAEFKSKIGDISKEIEESLPDIKEEMNDSELRDAIKIIRFVFGPIIFTTLIGIIFTILLLILLMNFKEYIFLIWYGAIFIIASLPFVAIQIIVPTITYNIDSVAITGIIKSVLSKIAIYSFGFLGIGIICIILAVILKSKGKKQVEEVTM